MLTVGQSINYCPPHSTSLPTAQYESDHRTRVYVYMQVMGTGLQWTKENRITYSYLKNSIKDQQMLVWLHRSWKYAQLCRPCMPWMCVCVCVCVCVKIKVISTKLLSMYVYRACISWNAALANFATIHSSIHVSFWYWRKTSRIKWFAAHSWQHNANYY